MYKDCLAPITNWKRNFIFYIFTLNLTKVRNHQETKSQNRRDILMSFKSSQKGKRFQFSFIANAIIHLKV
jgi:hypothetical protein